MRHSLAKKIISGVLAVGMFLTPGTLVFGDVEDGVNKNMKAATLVMKITEAPTYAHKHEGIKTVVNKLVDEGKLTRDKADQILKHVEEKVEIKEQRNKEQNPHKIKYQKYHLIRDLKDNGIINDAEAEAIRAKFRELREQIMTEKLNGMVQKGTITQIQSDKIKMYFENARKEKIEKIKNMTEEQRQAFFKENKRGHGVLKSLVDDGVITKEQAKELRKVLWEKHKN